MYYRHSPELPRPQMRTVARIATAQPESQRSNAAVAMGMLCVPLISFGAVLALYLTLIA
jgi:hypothetical protein